MSFDPRNNNGGSFAGNNEGRGVADSSGNRGGVGDGFDPRLLGNFEDRYERNPIQI